MTTLLAAVTLGISGSYFEARTCSVFAGPCHYSGEVMVDGGTGVVAWRLETGAYKGVHLDGVCAAALIHSDDNLSFGKARKSILYIDSKANASQRTAMIDLLRNRSGVDFGTIRTTKIASINLREQHIDISVGNANVYLAETSGRKCLACSMPGQLWYEPLGKGTDTRVATVEMQKLSDASLGETWTRRDEAAGFVGTFKW